MKKCGLLLISMVTSIYGMENVVPEWNGSCEQFVCCCAGSTAFLIARAYLFARTTPSEQFPIFRGFGPELAYPIECLHAATIAEFLGVLCCCYHHEWPTHSCCANAARDVLEIYCRASDSWARAMGWPICESDEDEKGSWAGSMFAASNCDGLPTYGDLAALVKVKVDSNKKQK